MNGVIVIDKEKNFTSFDVVAIMRKICREKKIGHTGTLDPMATGVLPILIGNATKAQSLLPDSDKEYEATIKFGVTTDTLDITGKILTQKPSNVTREGLEGVLDKFRGDIMQVPPMYSAVSKDGVRLYDLARKGIVLEREARTVTVYKLELTDFDEAEQCGVLKVCCSKGTYIRSICDDIGSTLGCGAVMSALRRTAACGFTVDDAVTLAKVRELAESGELESLLKSTDTVFEPYPKIKVTQPQSVRFKNGGGLMLSRTSVSNNVEDGTIFRVYGADNTFLGIGCVNKEKDELSVKKQF